MVLISTVEKKLNEQKNKLSSFGGKHDMKTDDSLHVSLGKSKHRLSASNGCNAVCALRFVRVRRGDEQRENGQHITMDISFHTHLGYNLTAVLVSGEHHNGCILRLIKYGLIYPRC